MMACSRNKFKWFLKCYQTKTNREMFQHDFQFFTNLMIFSQNINKNPFSYLILKFLYNFKPKKNLVMACVFECFQSHGHILKELNEFYLMKDAITIFEKNIFIFSFVDYGLVTKSLGVGCTFEEVAKETKCQKVNVNFLQPN